MSDESRVLAGILLLALVTVETGGLYMVKLVRGKADGAHRSSSAFARAGHAHAGVLLDPRAGLPAVRRRRRPDRRVELARTLAASPPPRC